MTIRELKRLIDTIPPENLDEEITVLSYITLGAVRAPLTLKVIGVDFDPGDGAAIFARLKTDKLATDHVEVLPENEN